MNYDQRELLKIKIKSLAEESKMIRKAEKRAKYASKHPNERMSLGDQKHARKIWLSMAGHRRGTVREESRATLLAYGFLRGNTLMSMESSTSPISTYEANLLNKKIVEMVEKYGIYWDSEVQSYADFKTEKEIERKRVLDFLVREVSIPVPLTAQAE